MSNVVYSEVVKEGEKYRVKYKLRHSNWVYSVDKKFDTQEEARKCASKIYYSGV